MDLQSRIAESENACAAMLDRLIAGNARMQQELSGFRAEVAAEFGALRSDVEAVKAEQARQGRVLDEILRRLSS